MEIVISGVPITSLWIPKEIIGLLLQYPSVYKAFRESSKAGKIAVDKSLPPLRAKSRFTTTVVTKDTSGGIRTTDTLPNGVANGRHVIVNDDYNWRREDQVFMGKIVTFKTQQGQIKTYGRVNFFHHDDTFSVYGSMEPVDDDSDSLAAQLSGKLDGGIRIGNIGGGRFLLTYDSCSWTVLEMEIGTKYNLRLSLRRSEKYSEELLQRVSLKSMFWELVENPWGVFGLIVSNFDCALFV